MWTFIIRFKVTLLSMCKWSLRDKRWEVDQGKVMMTFFYCITFLMLWLIQETGIYTCPPSLHVGATHILYVTALMICL